MRDNVCDNICDICCSFLTLTILNYYLWYIDIICLISSMF